MLSKNFLSIYRKWAIIALLLVGVYFFAYSDNAVVGLAAPCIEECEDNFASCRDECLNSCDQSSNSTACNRCLIACTPTYNSCMGNAVWCDVGNSYSPNCTVSYGLHCPIVAGSPDCSHSSAFNAYFMVCTQGGNTCVSCPGYRYCSGSGGVGACIP